MSAARRPIGVYLNDLRAEPREALRLASSLGYNAVQIEVGQGPLSPSQLSQSGRRHLRRFAGGLGLSIVALRADLGGTPSPDATSLEQLADRAPRILELARELGVATVAAPVGRFRLKDRRDYSLVRHALAHIADSANLLDRTFAPETTLDSPDALAGLLRDLDCPNLGVCYDPAELLMDGINSLAAVQTLADNIALAYVGDARARSADRAGRETNLGDGHLNLPDYLTQLDAAGYRGPLIVRRSESADPPADLQQCRNYLESVLTARAPH